MAKGLAQGPGVVAAPRMGMQSMPFLVVSWFEDDYATMIAEPASTVERAQLLRTEAGMRDADYAVIMKWDPREGGGYVPYEKLASHAARGHR